MEILFIEWKRLGGTADPEFVDPMDLFGSYRFFWIFLDSFGFFRNFLASLDFSGSFRIPGSESIRFFPPGLTVFAILQNQ